LFYAFTGHKFHDICFHALFISRYSAKGKDIYAYNKNSNNHTAMTVFILCLFLGMPCTGSLPGKLFPFQIVALIFLLLFVIWAQHHYICLEKNPCNAALIKMELYQQLCIDGCNTVYYFKWIPVVLFYISSFNYEQSLLAHYKQVEFAKSAFKKTGSY
jgi:hypothetical protein